MSGGKDLGLAVMVTGVNGGIGIFPTLSLRSGRGRSAAAGCGRRGCLVVDEPEAAVARSHAGVAALSRRGAIALAIIGRVQIAAALHGARRHEIGRGSCRERVCQYE